MRKKIFSVIFILGLVVFVLAGGVSAGVDNARVGTRVFNFLKVETAARPAAMAGAFTGVADDEASLYYNPSGLARLEGKHFLFGYHNSIMDIQSGFLGYIHPLGEGRKLSAYINYLNYGDFIRTDSLGAELGTFSGSDMLFAVGYSTAIGEQMSVGVVGKFIYESIENYSATGIAADLGAKYAFRDGRTSFGIAIQNLGFQLSGFTDNADKDPLPTYIRGGLSSRLKGLPLLVAADIIYPTDNDIFFAVGAEYLNLKPLFLRLGYTTYGANYKTDSDKDNMAGFSGGFGVDYKRLQISYSLSPQAELGTSHRVTLAGGF